MSEELSKIRKEYEAGALDESDLADSPWPLFRAWLEEAIAQRVCGMIRIRFTLSRWTPSTSASRA